MSDPLANRWPPIDYVFTLPDGSTRIETLFDNKDFNDFMKRHNAVGGQPVTGTAYPPCEIVTVPPPCEHISKRNAS